MKANKKLTAGSVIAIVAAVLSVISYIVYAVNLGSAGYFQGAAVVQMPLTWAAVAVLVAAAALSLVKAEGAASKVLSLVGGLLQIAAPVLLAYCLISLVAGRVEGLGFIYFSNADVAKEVQTAANMSSATMAIASMVCYGVSMLAAMVSAFVDTRKA